MKERVQALHRCISDLARQMALTQVGDGGKLLREVSEVPPSDPFGIPGTSCSEAGHWLYCICGDSCRDNSKRYAHFIEDHEACGEAGGSPEIPASRADSAQVKTR